MKNRKFVASMVVAGAAAAILGFTPVTAMAAGKQGTPASSMGQMSQSYKLNVNQASDLQMQRLGINPIVARNIVGYRQEHGPFKSTKDLLKVQGVTHQLLQRIQGKITVSNHSK